MHRLSQFSLTRRLTLLFVAVATSVLLGLGFVIANSVEAHFVELDMEVLVGKMALIRQGFQGVKTPAALMPFTHQLARSLVGHHGLEVLLMQTDGVLIFATQNANFNHELIFSEAAQAQAKPVLWTLQGQTYRGMAALLPTAALDSLSQPIYVVAAVATNIAHHQTYMQSFLQTLWLYVVCAAALTGVLGWLAVQSGLTPLRAMRAQAQVVTAQQLNRRLPIQSMPAELAELALSLNDMLARLEIAFGRLTDFSSDIAHELRTPVSNLMTQSQVALSRARSADDYKRVLESNAEEYEHLARMISDMLLLAKAENGLVLPNRESVNLAQEVQVLFDYYEALADEKGLSLKLEGSAVVQADRAMLRRALGNLLSNAVRHATSQTCILVTLSQTVETCSIAVRNVGETIAQEFLDRVFDRFFRADPSRQRSIEGVGLGLAITKSIVTMHGGSIDVQSEDGLTVFNIQLPISKD